MIESWVNPESETKNNNNDTITKIKVIIIKLRLPSVLTSRPLVRFFLFFFVK